VIYWAMPALKIWRDRLVPLTDERALGVGAYLEELCQEVGLSRPPAFLVNPHNPSASPTSPFWCSLDYGLSRWLPAFGRGGRLSLLR
jgi:hypothetical protein